MAGEKMKKIRDAFRKLREKGKKIKSTLVKVF